MEQECNKVKFKVVKLFSMEWWHWDCLCCYLLKCVHTIFRWLLVARAKLFIMWDGWERSLDLSVVRHVEERGRRCAWSCTEKTRKLAVQPPHMLLPKHCCLSIVIFCEGAVSDACSVGHPINRKTCRAKTLVFDGEVVGILQSSLGTQEINPWTHFSSLPRKEMSEVLDGLTRPVCHLFCQAQLYHFHISKFQGNLAWNLAVMLRPKLNFPFSWVCFGESADVRVGQPVIN